MEIKDQKDMRGGGDENGRSAGRLRGEERGGGFPETVAVGAL